MGFFTTALIGLPLSIFLSLLIWTPKDLNFDLIKSKDQLMENGRFVMLNVLDRYDFLPTDEDGWTITDLTKASWNVYSILPDLSVLNGMTLWKNCRRYPFLLGDFNGQGIVRDLPEHDLDEKEYYEILKHKSVMEKVEGILIWIVFSRDNLLTRDTIDSLKQSRLPKGYTRPKVPISTITLLWNYYQLRNADTIAKNEL